MKNCFGMLYFLFLLGSLLLSEKSHAQLKTYQFEQIDSLQIIQKRKVIVFIHTDWCKYCQAMKNTTFKNKEVIMLLNNYFYFLELNAEEKKTILFKGKQFLYKSTGNQVGTHDLSKELALINGQISYPTLCFIDDNAEILARQNGFIMSSKFIAFLKILNE
jgi:thioredoxin-related protein